MKKKIVKRKQTGKDKITTKNYRSHTSPPNAPKKTNRKHPKKQTHLKAKLETLKITEESPNRDWSPAVVVSLW